MKKTLGLCILFLLSVFVYAQDAKNEMELLTQLLGMNKKAMVADFVDLPDNDVFWTLYKEYEEQGKEIGEDRYQLLIQYAENFVNHSDEKLEEIMEASISLRNKSETTLETFYLKIKKECGTKTASQFYFVQRFCESTLSANVLGSLPIVEK